MFMRLLSNVPVLLLHLQLGFFITTVYKLETEELERFECIRFNRLYFIEIYIFVTWQVLNPH